MRRSRSALTLGALAIVVGVVVVPVASRTTTPPDTSGSGALADLREVATGPLDIRTDGSGRLTAVGTDPGRALDLGVDDPVGAAGAFARRFGAGLGATGTTLVPASTTDRLAGGVAVRFQQQVGGIPVFGGLLSVQVDADGGVLSGLADLSATADETPGTVAVSLAEARAIAVVATRRETGAPTAALRATDEGQWIHDPAVLGDTSPFGPRLTWRFEVTATTPPVRHVVLVDAATGAIAVSFSQLEHGGEREVCDFANIASASAACASPARIEGQAPVGQGEVDAAYDHSGAARDWYLTTFGRYGVDDAGMPVRTSVRYCKTSTACPYANAYWDGTRSVFGAGYATDDVVAHELTHGVTEHTAALFYWHQSGAINEAMSDIFGELIDLATPGDDDAGDRWLIGEDLAGGALRDMADPTSVGDPDAMTSPAFYGGSLDGGGVHSNSGVANRAAVLMTDGGSLNGHSVAGIGPAKVAAVHYEALTAVLTSASDYADLHVALPLACTNLIGVTGLGITFTDCDSVQDAVDAVAMDHVPTGQPTDAPVCEDGVEPQELFGDDFETTANGGWVKTRVLPSAFHWAWPVPAYARFATSGAQNLWGADTGDPWADGTAGTVGEFGDSRVAMTQDVVLPAGSTPYLRFRHAHGFEASTYQSALRHWDGGVVEFSTDGGQSWADLGALFDHNGYSGALNAPGGSPNPLWGRAAFVGSSKGFQTSRADLSSLAGQSVRFRFRVAEDEVVGSYGWFVDDVSLYLCPEPALTVGQTADHAWVTAGEDIDLHLTLTNSGNVTLTGVEVTEASASGCVGPQADLAPGASVTVDCTHATTDPQDIGTWTSNASATADQLDGPVAADPLEVEVLAVGTAALTIDHAAEATTVALGQPVPLGLTIQNTGNVELTGVAVAAPDAPGCARVLGDPLAPDAQVRLSCTHTPAGLGPWSSTVTVTAAELAAPVSAATGEVDVVDEVDPTVTLTSPADGAVFNQDQVVTADYGCEDDQAGPVSCTGPVADGAPVPTDGPGLHTFAVLATDAAGNETGVEHEYTVALRRPDGRIRTGPVGVERGDDLRNSTGAGQRRLERVPAGRSVTFHVTVQNDGSHTESLRVEGQRSTPNFAVRYLAGSQDVTAAVITGTYSTVALPPGATRTLRAVVTVSTLAPAGSSIDRLVTVRSINDPTRLDAVRFLVRRR